MNTNRFELSTGVQAACAAGMTVFGYAQYSDGAVFTLNGAKIVFNNKRSSDFRGK